MKEPKRVVARSKNISKKRTANKVLIESIVEKARISAQENDDDVSEIDRSVVYTNNDPLDMTFGAHDISSTLSSKKKQDASK